MPCYYPRKGYRSATLTQNGKRKIVFSPQEGYSDLPMEIPCGQCIGCRLERSRQWAVRCMHEASLHDDNCFITLTYDPEHVPFDFGLRKSHFQKFMKRLRKHFEGKRIRYYHCGEYGEENLRPHYHALLFGLDFDDKVIYSEREGVRLYFSQLLCDIWGKGLCTVGDVTFESASYVARYVLKKVNGDKAETHYRRVDPETGEEFQVLPEYTTMSRRPGIGYDWLKKYKTDCYPSDFIISRGMKMKPPKFYDRKTEEEGLLDEMEPIKKARRAYAARNRENNCLVRLEQREKVKLAQMKFLKRNLDGD